MSKWGRKQRPPPEGFEYIEPTLTALDNELRESKQLASYVGIYMFDFDVCACVLCVGTEVNEPHEGKRKTESQWPVHQINWQKR